MDFIEILAHEGEEIMQEVGPSLDEVVRSNSLIYSLVALGIVFILAAASSLIRDKSEKMKIFLFGLVTLTVLLNTLYLTGSTIYLNQRSITKGPVHWHADFEIWDCNKKVELVDPEGFSNKVGTDTFHEHNDQRIHIEGVVINNNDASLGKFFQVLGGQLASHDLIVPTEYGEVRLHDGDLCFDGLRGYLQVFVYKTDPKDNTFVQHKITDPNSYVISPYGNVPPGDCIIVELGPEKSKTDRLCQQYQLKLQKGEIHER